MSIGIKVLIRFCSLCNFIFQIFRKEKKARKIKITQNGQTTKNLYVLSEAIRQNVDRVTYDVNFITL